MKNKHIISSAVIIIFVLILARELISFNLNMFVFHDKTQASRIQQFALNLKHGIIPPRIAPNFSFNLGFPIFNFYAPTAYWFTGTLSALGLPIIASLKLGFLIPLIIGGLGIYFLTYQFLKSVYAGILSAIAYVSSPFMAVEIFVRGNLAEAWFLGLFPLLLALIMYSKKNKNTLVYISTIIVLALTLTAHNILSLISIGIIIIFAFLIKNAKKTIIFLLAALALDAYFFIPALLELHLTYARTIAAQTKFQDHFLCIRQLWTSPFWGFGGSVPGCQADGMSFQLGKLQVLIAGFSAIFFMLKMHIFKKTNKKFFLFFILGIFLSLFLIGTLYLSQPIWILFAPISKLFQFPWRLLGIGLIGIALLNGILFTIIRQKWMQILILIVFISSSFVLNYKKFYRTPIEQQKYKKQFISKKYIQTKAAYIVPEYLPKTVNYKYWYSNTNNNKNFIQLDKNLQVLIQTPFKRQYRAKKTKLTYLPVFLYPNWEIRVNKKKLVQNINIDKLGRPKILLNKDDKVRILYKEAPIQKLGNTITLLAILLIVLYSFKNERARIIKY